MPLLLKDKIEEFVIDRIPDAILTDEIWRNWSA